MPAREINLIPEQTYLVKEKEKKREKAILRLTVTVSIIAVFFILASYAYSLYLNSQADSIKKKINIERQKIDRMRNKEILLFWTKTKVLGTQKVLGARPLYEKQLKALDFVVDLLGEGLNMEKYSFKGQAVDFEILISDSNLVESFIDDLLEQNKDPTHFKMIKIDSVDLQEEGGYSLKFTITSAD